MTYLQLRITLDPSGNRNKFQTLNLLNRFVKKWLLPQDPSGVSYTTGYETLNKFGEPCDPHFHLNAHFDPPDLKDPLRSAKNFLRKEALAREFSLKGNKVWSCTLVEEPQDFDRWIRYPLKEEPFPPLCKISLIALGDTYDIDQLAHDSQVERKRSIELNIIKRTKAIDKQSLKDKLFKHLETLHEAFTRPESRYESVIWIAILNWYRDQGKAINFQTISGYTVLWSLHIGLLTPLDCYNMRSNRQ